MFLTQQFLEVLKPVDRTVEVYLFDQVGRQLQADNVLLELISLLLVCCDHRVYDNYFRLHRRIYKYYIGNERSSSTQTANNGKSKKFCLATSRTAQTIEKPS